MKFARSALRLLISVCLIAQSFPPSACAGILQNLRNLRQNVRVSSAAKAKLPQAPSAAGLPATSPSSNLLSLTQNPDALKLKPEALAAMSDEQAKERAQQLIAPIEGTAAVAGQDAELAPSLRERIAEKFGRLVKSSRVLPNREKQRQFDRLLGSYALVQVGTAMHETALPDLVVQSKSDEGVYGYLRSAGDAAQTTASAAVSPRLDRYDIKKTIARSIFWSAGVFAALPVALPAIGVVGSAAIWAIGLAVVATSFLLSVSDSATTVANNRIMGSNKAYFVKGDAVRSLTHSVSYGVGAGIAYGFITVIDKYFGDLTGNVWTYALGAAAYVGGALMLSRLSIPEDSASRAARQLRGVLRAQKAHVSGVFVDRSAAKPVLLVELKSGAPVPSAAGLSQEFGIRFEHRPPLRQRLTESLRLLKDALDLIHKNRFLKLSFWFSIPELLTLDAMRSVAMVAWVKEAAMAAADNALLYGGFGAAIALGAVLSSVGMWVWGNPPAYALETELSSFRSELKEEQEFSISEQDNAVDTVRQAVQSVQDSYKRAVETDPGYYSGVERFQEDVIAAVTRRLSEAGKLPSDVSATQLLSETELDAALRSWAEKFHERLTKNARREARGMDLLQRQGFWTFLLFAAGMLTPWAFLSHNPVLFLAAGFLGSLMQGPSDVVSKSLTRRSIDEIEQRHPGSMGKIVALLDFSSHLATIAGAAIMGYLLQHFPAATVFYYMAQLMTALAGVYVVEAFVIFLLKKK